MTSKGTSFARSKVAAAEERLVDVLNECDLQIDSTCDLIALKMCLQRHDIDQKVVDAVVRHYLNAGIEMLHDVQDDIPAESLTLAEDILAAIDFHDTDIVQGLSDYHWLMGSNPTPSDALVAVLTSHPPGIVLADKEGHYWIRRAKMVITRHRFISSVGDDTEKFYQQKFLLTVPITEDDDVVPNPPDSWVELCAQRGMCDAHLDALSCLQSAISRGFHTDQLRSLAQLYVEHGFLSDDEADAFLSDIPVLGEHDETEAKVTDTMLGDPQSDLGDLVPPAADVDVQNFINTFTESQLRAYRWVEGQFEQGRQVHATIVGPAGTGKSYLLKGLIELAKSKGLVVTKLAPSGVAAHLIGGTTVHNFFALDVEYNSTLENGTVQVAKLRKTDLLVIDEFSMMDHYLFRTAGCLCRKFAKHRLSKFPWGGRHVIMLGDPAQLPAVSRMDIFGTKLWRTFTILVLREIKRCQDPVLSSVLGKVRMGVCDQEVNEVLKGRLQPRNIDSLELERTVIICSTRSECEEVNDLCIKRMPANESVYEAIDTDHHGHPLREANKQTFLKYCERLPDRLVLKVGARVILRRNMNIEGGWVNGTLVVITSLHPSCIVVAKLANPTHKYPVPRFRQRIEIHGASYSILRQQFSLQLAYGVAVHRVQGCTVQKAVVCLGESFFASGQAYVALSRVRTLQDLVLWQFHPSAIFLHPFYLQLLKWCDSVDAVRPTPPPPTDVVEHPERNDDILSNDPIPDPIVNDEPKPTSIGFSSDPSVDTKPIDVPPKRGRGRPRTKKPPEPSTTPTKPKCGRGRPRKNKSSSATAGRGRPRKNQPDGASPPNTPQILPHRVFAGIKRDNNGDSSDHPPSKAPKLNTRANKSPQVYSVPSLPSTTCTAQHFLTRVQSLLGGTSPHSIFLLVLSLNSVQSIRDSLNSMGTAVEAMIQAVNVLPTPFASSLPHLRVAQAVADLCHPLMLQTLIHTCNNHC